MPSIAGNHYPVLTKISETFDPQYGRMINLHYEGLKSGISFLAEIYRRRKLRVQISSDNSRGVWMVDVQNPYNSPNNDPSGEAPVDKWSISTEVQQISIWQHPKLINLAGDSVVTLNLWRKEITDAIKNGKALAGTVSTQEQSIYNLVARGAESFTEKHIVVRRDRTTSTQYATPIICTASELMYSTAALIRLFGIPAAIAQQLPGSSSANPLPSVTPIDTQWAWVLRKQESDIVLLANKVQETFDWVFGAASIIEYTYVT